MSDGLSNFITAFSVVAGLTALALLVPAFLHYLEYIYKKNDEKDDVDI
jgi:hypothetical protein